MIRFLKNAVLTCAAVLTLSSCGTSRPSTFYVLDSMQTGTESTRIATASSPVLGIESVIVPPYLDKPQLVIRCADSPVVEVNEFHRWAEMISDAFPRILANAINTAAKKPLARPVASIRDVYTYRLYVDINRFDAVLNGDAVLEAWISITNTNTDTAPVTVNKIVLTEKAGASFDSTVAAQNKLIRRLGSLIAAYMTKTLKQ